jgi:hypothetical protein
MRASTCGPIARPLVCVSLFSILWLLAPKVAAAKSWPPVRPSVLRYHFQSASQAKLKTVIEEADGKPLYILECYASLAAPQTGEFMYSGDFECRLHSSDNKDHVSTLLTELPDADSDWESRGRFLAEQLVEPCGVYDNLGRRRIFRLRGFKLELNLSHVAFDESRPSFSEKGKALKAFDLEIIVSPDPTAISAIASTPSLPRLDRLPESCQQAFSSLYFDKFHRH